MDSLKHIELPDDTEQFLVITNPTRIRRAIMTDKVYSVLWEFDQWMRGEIKYRGQEWLQEVRDKFHEMMAEDGVSLDDYA